MSETGSEQVGERKRRQARDELNLAEFPLGLLHDKENPNRHTVSFEDTVSDKRQAESLKRKVTITSSPAFGGLPTAYDQDVLLALVTLTKENNSFTSREVEFTRSQLIDILKLPNNGKSYSRLARSFHKWQTVTVHYECGWWNRGESRWSDEAFAFIDNVRLASRESISRARSSRRNVGTLSSFAWNKVVFQSFCDDYVRAIDLDFYTSLRFPTSKRMYRFLAKRFHKSSRLRFDLDGFAFDKIGISRVHEGRPSRVIGKLMPAVRELESRGFLRVRPEEQRFTKRGLGAWEIVLESRAKAPSASRRVSGSSTGAALLVARGIQAVKAAELVTTFGEEVVLAKVQQFDFLKSSGAEIRSPAGFLVSSIVDDFSEPEGFRSQAARRQRTRKAADARAEAALEAERHERELACAWEWYLALTASDRAEVRGGVMADCSEFERRVIGDSDSMLFRCKVLDCWRAHGGQREAKVSGVA